MPYAGAIAFGGDILMNAFAATKGTYKWERAIVSCMNHGEKIWARIKVRGNREYAVVQTDQTEQCYGTHYLKIKSKLDM